MGSWSRAAPRGAGSTCLDGANTGFRGEGSGNLLRTKKDAAGTQPGLRSTNQEGGSAAAHDPPLRGLPIALGG